MVQLHPSSQPDVIYPDSDGQPMADNTKQFRWIVVLKENIELLLAGNPDVFVAGDLLWYPVEGSPTIRQAPDVLVAFGRPKGDRGSYKQWVEDNIPPQVVFEILSPGNRKSEMNRKLLFYDRYGVEEYYVYDPDTNTLSGWLRVDNFLDVIESMNEWVSPRLGIRFVQTSETLEIYQPSGQRFLSYVELAEQIAQAEQRADQAEQRADEAEQRADEAAQRAERLANRLRTLGINPDEV